MPKTLVYSFFFLCCIVNCNIYSQNYNYEHFGVDDGLPSSEIFDIYQSQDGYIWFATDRGLAKYNGYEFTKYGKKEGLPGDVILDFFPQPNNQIWCATLHTQKLFCFNEQFKAFTPYKYNNILRAILPQGAVIESVYIDHNNTLHIGGSKMNGEIVISENGTILKSATVFTRFEKKIMVSRVDKEELVFCFFSNEALSLNDNELKVKVKDLNLREPIHKDGHTLFIDKTAVKIFNNKRELVKTINTDYMAITINTINATKFLIGYNYHGAQIIDINGNIKASFLEGESVTSFLIDHDGGYWFSTLNAGVFYLKNPNIYTMPLKITESKSINSLATNEKNDLYIAYNEGDVIKCSRNKTFSLTTKPNLYIGSASVEYDTINDKLYTYSDGVVTIYFQNSKKKIPGYVLKFSEPQNNAVLATTLYGVKKVSFSNMVIKDFKTRCLDACLFKNNLFIGTPEGLFVENKSRLVSLSGESKLLSYRIEDIDIHPNKKALFMATIGGGVVVYTNDDVYNIGFSDGLYSDNVNEVQFENERTLWVCTDSGINKIDFFEDRNYKISGLNIDDGLLSNEVEDIEIIKDTVWIGTKNGLCYFPKQIVKDKIVSKVFLKLKKITVNESPYSIEPSIKLNYNENRITFFVEGVSFYNSNKLTYKYKLKGLNDAWHYSKTRDITFASLPYGSYIFIATVCNEDNEFCSDEIVKQSFIILPPFWKRWWFYLLCFSCISVFIYLFFKYRILSYNKDITRELIRLIIKKLKKKEKYLIFRESGKDIRIKTNEILHVRSSGNYIDIITDKQNHTVRCKISEFIALTPDPLEYVRIHRSFIIRLDKVKSKSKNEVVVHTEVLAVSAKYIQELDKIHF